MEELGSFEYWYYVKLYKKVKFEFNRFKNEFYDVEIFTRFILKKYLSNE